MATCSGILAWKIPWPEEPSGLYSPWGCKMLCMTEDNYVWGSLRWKEMARLSCTWSIISCDGLVVVQSMSRV